MCFISETLLCLKEQIIHKLFLIRLHSTILQIYLIFQCSLKNLRQRQRVKRFDDISIHWQNMLSIKQALYKRDCGINAFFTQSTTDQANSSKPTRIRYIKSASSYKFKVNMAASTTPTTVRWRVRQLKPSSKLFSSLHLCAMRISLIIGTLSFKLFCTTLAVYKRKKTGKNSNILDEVLCNKSELPRTKTNLKEQLADDHNDRKNQVFKPSPLSMAQESLYQNYLTHQD